MRSVYGNAFFLKGKGRHPMRKLVYLTVMALVFSLSGMGLAWGDAAPGDRDALKGLYTCKVIFDVRISDPEKMIFNLELIKETLEGMQRQGVKPAMIAAFRGPGVKLLSREGTTDEIRDLIVELKKKGVRIEVCAVATRVFKVDNSALLPDVVLVGNVLTSLIGYQNKGYALVILM
jgi:intracellular sulfur oxidation DsrE/DsrF family protein